MNNEIQQIAQQNDMNIEFVHWFFNEKKAACGEQWFLALGAMWEGWKAREGEATALALTFEKSREASGCPAGVDLQDWVKQLAAENVGMKSAITDHSHSVHFCEVCGKDDPCSTDDVCYVLNETPATDRIVAEAEARGVEKFAKKLESRGRHQDYVAIANAFAKQLREGAK
ncbi:hypothetical protein [Klebsiella aerogenes]|uniref:hypothetical protein n=1 Tax=Klebsiella aerogenes TaxID=548 RepID=UPI00163D1DDA|nr:hypothetical protein [Klebsiella aerogenes]